MAVHSNDPTDGHPVFVDGDAPDIKVDPTAAAAYAGEYAWNKAGPTAQRLAFAFGREGFTWYDTDLNEAYLHDGSGWKLWHKRWTTYTPTTSNVSGSPTIIAKYAVAAGVVHVKIYVLCNGANFGTGPTFSLPVTAAAIDGIPIVGQALCRDISPSQIIGGRVILNSTTVAAPVLDNASGTYSSIATNVTAGAPFSWASGDFLNLEFSYEAA